MAIEQTGGCLFQRKLTQNMDISICKNSIKETLLQGLIVFQEVTKNYQNDDENV